MGINGRIPGSTSEGLIVTVRYVLSCLGIPVSFRQPEVDHVYSAFLGINSHQKVVRLHVSVQKVLCVHEFNSRDHLLS